MAGCVYGRQVCCSFNRRARGCLPSPLVMQRVELTWLLHLRSGSALLGQARGRQHRAQQATPVPARADHGVPSTAVLEQSVPEKDYF